MIAAVCAGSVRSHRQPRTAATSLEVDAPRHGVYGLVGDAIACLPYINGNPQQMLRRRAIKPH